MNRIRLMKSFSGNGVALYGLDTQGNVVSPLRLDFGSEEGDDAERTAPCDQEPSEEQDIKN